MTVRAFPGQAGVIAGGSRVSLSRLFWQSIIQLAILLVLLAPPISLGARLEGTLFPIRTHQFVPKDSIRRTGDRLCWTWVSDKVRMATSDNIDVFLETTDGDRSYPEVFDQITNVPWHRNGAVPVGHYERSYCIALPSYIKPGDPIHLRQIVHYIGFWNLWTVLVPLPDISSP